MRMLREPPLSDSVSQPSPYSSRLIKRRGSSGQPVREANDCDAALDTLAIAQILHT